MNQNFKQSLQVLLVLVFFFMCVKAMNSQILKIEGHVTLDKISTLDRYTVKVLDMETDSVFEFKSIRLFSHKLEFNKNYTVVISKKGYQSKSIFFNTHCTYDGNFRYIFNCNLDKDDNGGDIVCQAGGVFYNSQKQNFDYYYHGR